MCMLIKIGWSRLPLTLLLVAVFFNGLFSQAPVVKISPELKIAKSHSFQSHLFSDAGGHYIAFDDENSRTGINLSGSITRVILEKYDPNFKLEFSKTYESDKKGVASLGIRYFNGQFLWLFSETNKREDYIRYNLSPIDLKGKKGKAIEVAKLKYESRDDRPTVFWNASKDSTKLLFRAVTDDDRIDAYFKVFISVLNKDLSVNWSQKVALPYTEEQVEVLGTILKNDGSVDMLAKVYEGKRAKESKKNEDRKSVAAYEIKLFHFAKGAEKPTEFPLRLGDAFIRGASLATDEKDNLKCAGFYATAKNGSIQGMFYLDIASNGEIRSSNKKSFTITELKQFGERNTDKDRGGDFGLENSFTFSDFLIRADGSAVVVAEENYFTVSTNYYGRTYTTTTRYYSNDIIIFSINSAGEIERTSSIPKYQIGVNTKYFLSHVSLVDGNNIAFFYNEDEDNMAKPVKNPKPKLVNDFNDCVAVMTTLTPDGQLTRSSLFEAQDVEALFVPNLSSPFDTNKLFFVSIKPKLFGKNNFRMGTVVLPKA